MELPEETERNEGDLLYEHMSVLFVQKDMSSNMFFQAKTQFWSMIFQRGITSHIDLSKAQFSLIGLPLY